MHPGDTITVSAHVTDDGGVGVVALEVDAPGRPMICGHGAATLSDGTVHDGTWSTTCVLPVDAPTGSYSVSPWGSDIAGNAFIGDGVSFDVSGPGAEAPSSLAAAPAPHAERDGDDTQDDQPASGQEEGALAVIRREQRRGEGGGQRRSTRHPMWTTHDAPALTVLINPSAGVRAA